MEQASFSFRRILKNYGNEKNLHALAGRQKPFLIFAPTIELTLFTPWPGFEPGSKARQAFMLGHYTTRANEDNRHFESRELWLNHISII
jgi:hypothetical protein